MENSTFNQSGSIEIIIGAYIPGYIITCAAAVTGTVGNLLVLCMIATDRHLRTLSNVFVTSLAAADLQLVSVGATGYWAFGLFALTVKVPLQSVYTGLCYMSVFPLILNVPASALSLFMLVSERFIVIYSPFHHVYWINKRSVGLGVAVTWILSVGAAVWPLVSPKSHPENNSIPSLCPGINISKMYFYGNLCLVILVHMISIILYGLIARYAVRHSRAIVQIELNVGSAVESANVSSNPVRIHKSLKSFVLVIFGIFIFYGPYWCFAIAIAFSRRSFLYVIASPAGQGIYTMIISLLYGLSASNPWLYTLRNKTYRDALVRLYERVRRPGGV